MTEPTPPFKVVSLYAYGSEYEDDLPFDTNQVITVDSIEDDEWYSGHYIDSVNFSKKEGIFPKNFVEILANEPNKAPASVSTGNTEVETTEKPTTSADAQEKHVLKPESNTETTSQTSSAPQDTLETKQPSLHETSQNDDKGMATETGKPTPSVNDSSKSPEGTGAGAPKVLQKMPTIPTFIPKNEPQLTQYKTEVDIPTTGHSVANKAKNLEENEETNDPDNEATELQPPEQFEPELSLKERIALMMQQQQAQQKKEQEKLQSIERVHQQEDPALEEQKAEGATDSETNVPFETAENAHVVDEVMGLKEGTSQQNPTLSTQSIAESQIEGSKTGDHSSEHQKASYAGSNEPAEENIEHQGKEPGIEQAEEEKEENEGGEPGEDDEEARRLALRARMAKLSGAGRYGGGPAGFNPFGGIPMAPASSKAAKRASVTDFSNEKEGSSTNNAQRTAIPTKQFNPFTGQTMDSKVLEKELASKSKDAEKATALTGEETNDTTEPSASALSEAEKNDFGTKMFDQKPSENKDEQHVVASSDDESEDNFVDFDDEKRVDADSGARSSGLETKESRNAFTSPVGSGTFKSLHSGHTTSSDDFDSAPAPPVPATTGTSPDQHKTLDPAVKTTTALT
ncbi:hypothetical protein ACO0RG_002195 [Hanseniaspora osmophila]